MVGVVAVKVVAVRYPPGRLLMVVGRSGGHQEGRGEEPVIKCSLEHSLTGLQQVKFIVFFLVCDVKKG